jgi:RNA recognition motif-containing protein
MSVDLVKMLMKKFLHLLLFHLVILLEFQFHWTMKRANIEDSGKILSTYKFLSTNLSFVEFELPEDAAAATDNMNDSEIYGRTIRVNFARPPKVNERSQRPIWADDEWLKQYGQGSGREEDGEKSAEPDAGLASVNESEEGTERTQRLPRVYLGIKIGIR